MLSASAKRVLDAPEFSERTLGADDHSCDSDATGVGQSSGADRQPEARSGCTLVDADPRSEVERKQRGQSAVGKSPRGQSAAGRVSGSHWQWKKSAWSERAWKEFAWQWKESAWSGRGWRKSTDASGRFQDGFQTVTVVEKAVEEAAMKTTLKAVTPQQEEVLRKYLKGAEGDLSRLLPDKSWSQALFQELNESQPV